MLEYSTPCGTVEPVSLHFSCHARTQLEELISPKLAGIDKSQSGEDLTFELVYPQGETQG